MGDHRPAYPRTAAPGRRAWKTLEGQPRSHQWHPLGLKKRLWNEYARDLRRRSGDQADRTILLQYYSPAKRAKIEPHRELAERDKLTPNALRNRVFRLNHGMARCVNNCLENLGFLGIAVRHPNILRFRKRRRNHGFN
jgi:hypothetical protein